MAKVKQGAGITDEEPFRVDPSEVEPLDSHGVTTFVVGSIAWLVAFVLLLPFYSQLESAGRLWWLWTCLAGFGLGMYGIEVARWRRKREHGPEVPPQQDRAPATRRAPAAPLSRPVRSVQVVPGQGVEHRVGQRLRRGGAC